MKYSFVIPCYRSEHTIKQVVDELTDEIGNKQINDYEIILVNDCSPDNVWIEIKKLIETNARIKGINLAKNFGQHAALLAGYKMSTGDIVVSLDDDGQCPINELDKLLKELQAGNDVVYAYYPEIKQKAFRKFGTWIATEMSRMMLGAPKDFKGSSFYVARRFVIEEIVNYDKPYPYLLGLILRTTRKIGYVKTSHRSRLEGKSGYNLKSLLSLWMNGFTAFSVKPLEIGTVIGVLLSVIGVVLGIITAVRKILNPAIMAGWSSLFAVNLFVGGMILLILGLIGEYIGRIYICINKAPQYVIRETIEQENIQADDVWGENREM